MTRSPACSSTASATCSSPTSTVSRPPPDTVPARLRELVTRVCKLDKDLMLVLDTEKAVDHETVAA